MRERGREYQDNWCKYAESLEKDSTNVKVREEGRDRRRGGRNRMCVRGREGVCEREGESTRTTGASMPSLWRKVRLMSR